MPMDPEVLEILRRDFPPLVVTNTPEALLYGGLSGLSFGGLSVDTPAAAEHPWGIIIGLYLGALYATFALTRGMNWLLRARGTQERKSAILSFVIAELIALCGGSPTIGFGRAFVIYIPCLIFWLTVDLNRAAKREVPLYQTILAHPRVLGTAIMLAGSLLVIVPL